MLRGLILAACVAAFALSTGCDSGNTKDTNPGNLSYSKDGPPKRDGIKGEKKK